MFVGPIVFLPRLLPSAVSGCIKPGVYCTATITTYKTFRFFDSLKTLS